MRREEADLMTRTDQPRFVGSLESVSSRFSRELALRVFESARVRAVGGQHRQDRGEGCHQYSFIHP